MHVKTLFHVSISPYEMKISSSKWMSLVARRTAPCRSRHSPVSSSLRMTIRVISAFMHFLQQEWFAGGDGGFQVLGPEGGGRSEQHNVDAAIDDLLEGVEADEAGGVLRGARMASH